MTKIKHTALLQEEGRDPDGDKVAVEHPWATWTRALPAASLVLWGRGLTGRCGLWLLSPQRPAFEKRQA